MCGIFGIVSNENVARQISLGLYDLQHRGEQGAGMAVFDGDTYWAHKGEGLVIQVFPEEVIREAVGNFGIGYTRYSTIGDLEREDFFHNIQPLRGRFQGESFWVAHNGNLVDLDALRKEAEGAGYRFRTTSDTEVIVGLLSVAKEKDFLEALIDVLPKLKGAFSLVILHKNQVIGVRDMFGIRPLCIGRNESSFIVASESCAFHTLQGNFLFDVKPGEIIVLDQDGINSQFIWAGNPQLKLCIVELIYFARPDSVLDGQSVYFYRERAGELLAKEHPVEADVVIAVPTSGEIYDLGLSRESGIPLGRGIFRNRYFATRTFLTRRGTDRAALQRIKLHPLRRVVHDKRVLVTDDSIIRGNVIPSVVAMLREEGAAEVHVRVGSSPICNICYLGMDMATKGELIASSLQAEEVRKYIQADSLGYLSVEGMVEASGFNRENLSLGCFTGEYAVEPPLLV